MNIHEYQAKDLLKAYGIPVPPGEVVYTMKAAARVAEEIGGQRWVVKAQIDRATQRIVVIASADGGVDIEQVAEEHPERIHKEVVDPATGLLDFQCRKLGMVIGLQSRLSPFVRIVKRVYRLFRDKDATLAEINPLVITDDGDFLALDCKITFDDNALFRQGEVAELRDFDEEDPKEVEASGHGLNYIALDGQVGCIVNGAGLAMATMDAVVFHGGRPANFLDVCGGAAAGKGANAFRIVLKDPNVRGVLVNIFAGINRCDWIARGIVQATHDQAIDVPIVVRLAGTNQEEGSRILAGSGLDLITAEDLDDAAAKAVTATSEVIRV